MMMMSHAEPVIGLVFHPYCRHPSDGGAHQTDGLGHMMMMMSHTVSVIIPRQMN